MTLERFQSIVLRLGNQMFVRHHIWLNYPNEPQIMGIELIGRVVNRKKGRKATCDCGACRKCRNRELRRGNCMSGRLTKELEAEGFKREPYGIWVIERGES